MSARETGPDAPGAAASRALRVTSAVAIAAIAVMRCVIFFAPQQVFDYDPALFPEALGGLGPAGSLWLDAALLMACAAGLLGEGLARRRIDVPLVLCALVPVPVAIGHGLADAGDLWRGMTWCAAVLAAVTVAHLARDARLRTLLAALLVAAVVPVLVRGAANVTYEFAEQVAEFEARKEAILLDQGWEADSPGALIFERRLRQRQPLAWFITTNVFGSLAAFGLLAWAGLAAAGVRGRGHKPAIAGAVLVAVAAVIGVWMTGSKGAVLAALGGATLLALVLAAARRAAPVRAWAGRCGSLLAVGLVVLTLAAVALRGAVLPESFAGDRSLLFRWHYTVAAARVVGEHPLAGAGPDGFQAAYVRHRVPRNPEEVASAHSIVWDWLAGLGLPGAAWIVVLGVLVWRAGRAFGATGEDAPVTVPDDADPVRLRRGLAAVVIGLVLALVTEAHQLHGLALAVRGLGIAAFVAAALAAWRLWWGSPRLAGAALAVGAVVLVVHGQIEMTFVQPGAAVWALAVLGLAGALRPARADGPSARPAPAIGAAGLLAVLGIWIAVAGAAPLGRAETAMREAAAMLWPLADGAPGTVDRRRAAAEALLTAADDMPTFLTPRIAAAVQFELAARGASEADRIALFSRAATVADDCIARGDRGRGAVVAIFAHGYLAQLTGDPAHAEASLATARLLAEADPNGLRPRVRLADVLWAVGRHDEARDAYERALEIDEAFELDPLKRMPERERRRVEERRAEGVARPAG